MFIVMTTIVPEHMSMNRGETVSGDEAGGTFSCMTEDTIENIAVCVETFGDAVMNRTSLEKILNNIHQSISDDLLRGFIWLVALNLARCVAKSTWWRYDPGIRGDSGGGQAAKFSIIVAINKIEKEDARVDQVEAHLARHDVDTEGKYMLILRFFMPGNTYVRVVISIVERVRPPRRNGACVPAHAGPQGRADVAVGVRARACMPYFAICTLSQYDITWGLEPDLLVVLSGDITHRECEIDVDADVGSWRERELSLE
ncbi:translation initiation factor IF-2 [Fusarium circinatum]|uniref:Translation initiation factor IF-2 n=1 Tax=Fusarium circinatum TaxID=48490 RepID=A0A8H5UHL6_FUSCI|nr:translation initiation factor IF-2 [Fusarium circinatum]